MELRQRILSALQTGDEPALRTAVNEAMASGLDPHSGYELLYGTGSAPLIVAARNGHESCILTLLELGADV